MNPPDSQGTIIEGALISGDSGVAAQAKGFNHWIAAFADKAIIDPIQITPSRAIGTPGEIISGVIDPAHLIVAAGNHDRWQRGVIYDRPDLLAERRDNLVEAIKSSVDEICRVWRSNAADFMAGHGTPCIGVIHTPVGNGKTTNGLYAFWPRTITGQGLSEKLRRYIADIDSHAMRPMLGPIVLPAADGEPWRQSDVTLVAHPRTPESVARMEALARSLTRQYAASFLARYLLERRKNRKTLARVVWRWLKKMVPVRGINFRNRLSARQRQQCEDYREKYIIIRPLTGIRVRITQQALICLPGMSNVGNLPVKRGEHDDYVFVRLGSSRRDLGCVAHARRAVAPGRRPVADGHRARPGRRGSLRGAAAPVGAVGRPHSRARAA